VTGSFTQSIDFDPGPGIEEYTANDDWEEGDTFLSKFDLNGDFIWTRTWGSVRWDDGFAVMCDSLDNIYVLGEYSDTVDFDPGPGVDLHTAGWYWGEVFLSKFPPDGSW
jgi:hypothetical protein